MRLGFDATSVTRAGKGVARFQREFLHAADEHHLLEELDVFIPLDPDRASLPKRAGWRYHHVTTSPMVVWEQLRRPYLARRLKLDAILTLSERAALWGPPEIVYVFEHPKHRTGRSHEVGTNRRQRIVDLTTLAQFRLTRMRAAALVAASRSTASDIGTDTVVYSGVSSEFTPADRPRTYFLHLASDDPRDNSEVAIDAYARSSSDIPLVVAGSIDRVRPALQERASRQGVEVDWRGFQTGEALVELYRGAIAYVDPSLYEGFGLQAAEALACGTPVIASNRTSLPEVVGGGGILLNPSDVPGFAAAMSRVAHDSPFAAELGLKAIEQAAQFTWAATVRRLLEVCASVVALKES